mgnify:CR=1 FL=1
MIVEMVRGASQEQVDAVVERARSYGCEVQLNVGTDKVVAAILGSDTGSLSTDVFAVLPGVQSVTRVMVPYKLASREFRPQPTVVRIGDVAFGGPRFAVIAGPCSIESHEQLLATARHVRHTGATVLRGGAFKPRTSPFSFQGLGIEGVRLLEEVRRETGLPVVSEITNPAYTVRVRWENDSIGVWDNRITAHQAPTDLDHLDVVRVLHRTTVEGDVPVGPDGLRSVSVIGEPFHGRD